MSEYNKVVDVNTVVVSGFVSAKPELKYTANKTAVTNIRLGINNLKDTTWVTVVIFGSKAEIAAQYLDKGRKIHTSGRLQVIEKNNTRYVEIITNDFQFIPTGGKPAKPTVDVEAEAATLEQSELPSATEQIEDLTNGIPF